MFSVATGRHTREAQALYYWNVIRRTFTITQRNIKLMQLQLQSRTNVQATLNQDVVKPLCIRYAKQQADRFRLHDY